MRVVRNFISMGSRDAQSAASNNPDTATDHGKQQGNSNYGQKHDALHLSRAQIQHKRSLLSWSNRQELLPIVQPIEAKQDEVRVGRSPVHGLVAKEVSVSENDHPGPRPELDTLILRSTFFECPSEKQGWAQINPFAKLRCFIGVQDIISRSPVIIERGSQHPGGPDRELRKSGFVNTQRSSAAREISDCLCQRLKERRFGEKSPVDIRRDRLLLEPGFDFRYDNILIITNSQAGEERIQLGGPDPRIEQEQEASFLVPVSLQDCNIVVGQVVGRACQDHCAKSPGNLFQARQAQVFKLQILALNSRFEPAQRRAVTKPGFALTGYKSDLCLPVLHKLD